MAGAAPPFRCLVLLENDHPAPRLAEGHHGMAADVPGSAGDQDGHRSALVGDARPVDPGVVADHLATADQALAGDLCPTPDPCVGTKH